MINTETKYIVYLLNWKFRNRAIEFSEQYVKSNKIFYKVKGTNIAFTKNLNYIDFGILEKEDLEYLITKDSENITDNEIEQYKNQIEQIKKELNSWIINFSKISKIENVIDNFLKSSSLEISTRKELLEKEAIINLFINKRINFIRSDRYMDNGEEIILPNNGVLTLEVELKDNEVTNESGELVFDNTEILIIPSDNNIRSIEDNIVNTNAPTLLKAAAILFLLILKYHEAYTDPSFLNYQILNERMAAYSNIIRRVNQISNPGAYSRRGSYSMYNLANNHNRNTGPLIDHYMNYIAGSINKELGDTYNIYSILIKAIGFNLNRYYCGNWELRNSLSGYIIRPNINYSNMTDEHLLKFRVLTNIIISEHASYIKKDIKELESYLLFFGSNELKGKKKTAEDFEEKFKLSEMKAEIERRGI